MTLALVLIDSLVERGAFNYDSCKATSSGRHSEQTQRKDLRVLSAEYGIALRS
jgi:hypothetical protein